MMEAIQRALGPIRRQLGNMIARGVLAGVVATSKMQRVQVRLLSGEVKDLVEHFEPYGFTSRAWPGAEHLTVFLDGDRSHGVTLVVADRRYRLAGLASGEMAIYDDLGQKVHLTRDGIVIHTAKTLRLEAKDIVMHAGTSWSWDVNGLGERWTSTGGSAYTHQTWQTGATITSTTGPINPPEGP